MTTHTSLPEVQLIRVLIVDDEPAARANLRRLLTGLPGVEVVGECENGETAVKFILEHRVDLAFLDIQMPGLDGIAVGRAIENAPNTKIVFVTAHDEHALQAFDVNASGYLLKPVRRERLLTLVERRRHELASADQAEVVSLLRDALDERKGVTRLAIKTKGRTLYVPTQEITWLEADNMMVRIHANGRTFSLRESIGSLETILGADFLRVHRSAIVRIGAVREVQPWFRGDFVLILTDGSEVHTGHTYRDSVRKLLSHH